MEKEEQKSDEIKSADVKSGSRTYGLLAKSKTINKALREFGSGISLAKLGAKYELSGERIRQILHDHKKFEKAKENRKKNNKKKKEKKWNKIVAQFIELVKREGRVLTREETQKQMKLRVPAEYSYLRKHARACGYDTKRSFDKEKKHKEKREEMLVYLKDLAKKCGHTPTVNELKSYRKFWGASYDYYFGSLSEAQKLAGLKPNTVGNSHELSVKKGEYIAKEKCIESLMQINQQLGRKPTWKEVEKYTKIKEHTYRKRLSKVECADFIDIRAYATRSKLSN